MTQSIGSFFNRSVSFDPKLTSLDKDIPTETFIYSHPVIIGLCLVAGSIFALIFFFFHLDIANFANVFLGSPKYFITFEIIFICFAWVARIACALGLLFGLFLLFAPGKMRMIEAKVNTWFETRTIFEKLDRSGPELDVLFFRYPFFFGMTSAIISFLIITLSIVNLLS
jgi:hypothetical protein